ncbi:MAG: GDP-mannose 4,6-dehydratase [Armatimonadetes bacterium]|nr:GDP-mannose 4,6-dehydratase [Armatimonadota bacterium]
MRTLVTGGAGFIGSHLCEELLARGDEVVALDNFSTGRLENLKAAMARGSFELVEGDVLDPDLVASLVAQVDRVVHLAAAVGVALVIERPLYTLEVNLLGTHHVLDACARSGKPVLIASTSEVYGHQVADRFNEETPSLLGPVSQMRWVYAVSKLADEYLARAYAAERGLQVICARFFNTTGPRQSGRYGMVVPRFVRAAMRGEPLTVFGDGSQVRCFCHVSDAVRAVAELLQSPDHFGQSFNIGSDEPTTILDLAHKVLEITGSPSPIEFVPLEQAYGVGIVDIEYRVPDISKLVAATGWRPTRTLADIISDIVARYSAEG